MFNVRIENLKKLNEMQDIIKNTASIIKNAILDGNKILFCGNGGSASDSNHLCAEFICRFQKERKSIPAISLVSNNSVISAIANDYSFDDIFKRQIESLGKKGDILIAISTSSKSKNVLNAIEQAKKQDMTVILLTGENNIKTKADITIKAPSKITCEIQEMHIAIGHILCEIIENELF